MSDLVTKVCAVMEEVGAIAKDRENTFHKYKYVSAEAVRAAVQKACVKHGLILRLSLSDETVTPSEAVMKCSCSVSMDGVTFVHLGDGWGAGMDKGDKGPMKSVTAASKYALANAFCISLGEDPEADADTDKRHKPDDRLGAEERARADSQATAKATAKQEAEALIQQFLALTHVDDVAKYLYDNVLDWDVMEPTQRTRVFSRAMKHADSGIVEGLNGAGLKTVWKAALDAARERSKQGGM